MKLVDQLRWVACEGHEVVYPSKIMEAADALETCRNHLRAVMMEVDKSPHGPAYRAAWQWLMNTAEEGE